MNPTSIQHRLESQDVPNVELPLHQERLRAALLHAHRQQRRRQWKSFLPYSPLNMITQYKWPAIATTLVAVVSLVFMSSTSPMNQRAYAQEIIHNIIFHLNELSPAEKVIIGNRMAADIETALSEAQTAADLRTIPVKNFEREMRDMHKDIVARYPDMDFPEEVPMLQYDLAQILRYTDVNGKVVTIGIDTENIPVMKMVGLDHADYLQLDRGIVPEDHLKLAL